MRILRFLAALGMTALALPLVAGIKWQTWDAALAQAQRDHKPIFLSIGYKSCHWCHVMEAESFSDDDVAAALARDFVAVHIDREARPDIDAVYTAAAQRLMSDVGWPLNLLLTPDGKPFFAATYLPKAKLLEVLSAMAKVWREQPAQFETMAKMVADDLARQTPPDAEGLGRRDLDEAYRDLAADFDAKNGGFGLGAKFPAPQNIFFLLRYWKRTGEPHALEMAEATLRAMRRGALFDPRNGGFHRYTVDAAWREPHKEKMLYDQALLALAYIEAFQATHKEEYADTSRRTLDYALHDLRAPNGAFFSSKDADSDAHDEKLLTDWNGLMVAALSAAAVALDEPSYAKAAARAARAVSFKEFVHQPGTPAFLDDYAFYIWGLLNLYEATADTMWLGYAIDLQEKGLKKFAGGFLSAKDDLFVRYRTVRDAGTPAGTAVQAANLLRLARMTAREEFAAAARDAMRSAAAEVRAAPTAAVQFMIAVDFALGPSFEVVLAGEPIAPLKRAVFGAFVPNKVVLYRTPEVVRFAPFTKEQTARGGKATAYVCRNYVCNLPTGDPAKVAALMK